MTAPPNDAPLYDVSTREGFLRRAADVTDRRIPPRFRRATATHPDVTAWCRDFSPESPSLLIFGPTGSGKTHQAYGAVRTLAAAGVTVSWEAATAPDMYASLRPRDGVDSEAELARLTDTDLLIVDDLGAAKVTEWTEEILYRLVNHRYEAMTPGIFTSNVRGRELRSMIGDRVASRLAEMCRQIDIDAPDRRRAAK